MYVVAQSKLYDIQYTKVNSINHTEDFPMFTNV